MIDAATNELEALRLMLEWGADEALLDSPIDRFALLPAPAATPQASAPMAAGPMAGVSVATVPVAAPPRPATAIASLAAGPALAQQAAAAAGDLAALHAAIDGFTACPLRVTASSTIAPSGNPAAGLVLVYDTPGPDDDRAGMAFSGPPGERLDRVLGSVGLDRTRFLAAPLIPWRPPGGRPASDAELALCLPFLQRLLVLTRPRHIVLLGAGPHRALATALGSEDAGFRKARGKWGRVTLPGVDAPIPALPMLSADLWLSTPANRQTTWTDLLQLITATQDS
jgi:DNA polymerase